MNSLCVFCGSNPGASPAYAEAAARLGRIVAERGMTLVYGGGRVGLMGVVAGAALAAGGRVIGVIPEALATLELAHDGLTALEVVGSMHERKARMSELSDGFLALPGGIGTLEEWFEVWTWSQLGFHPKPCGLLNVAGYYDHLLAFLDHVTAERFLNETHRSMAIVGDDPQLLLDRLAAWRPSRARKWIEAEER
ncbi:MAG TPA: TIGR00730 family Rossman fold protein [Thermoanaerobaculia bacterium]|nr:TIGR00730 family Rossman fold protein [Thermoanaerobaculia bacterium]